MPPFAQPAKADARQHPQRPTRARQQFERGNRPKSPMLAVTVSGVSHRSVIYARQSLDRSGEGAAVDRQVADCQRVAHQRGWSVVETITDNDMSASTGKPRPGYQRLLSLMHSRTLDAVIVWHVDRLTRRLVDLEEVI